MKQINVALVRTVLVSFVQFEYLFIRYTKTVNLQSQGFPYWIQNLLYDGSGKAWTMH